MSEKRIGIFSGTFDPVHKGHISFALDAADKANLDAVYFAPEVKPRRKPHVTHIARRVAMLNLATRPYRNLKVLELPDKYFLASTTLPKLQQKFGTDRIVLLMGSDLFEHMPKWPKVETMLSKVGLLIGARGTFEVSEVLAHSLTLPSQALELHVVDSIERHTSSAQIRAQLMAGKSSDELLPSVSAYAKKHWLYHDISKAKKR